MKQIITGPFGRVAYHNTDASSQAQYPALNMPCTDFARGDDMVAANDIYAPIVIQLPRQINRRAAIARFGRPA